MSRAGVRILLFFLLLLFLAFLPCSILHAEEDDGSSILKDTEERLLEEFDFSEINEQLKGLFPGEKIRFQEVVSALIKGNPDEAGTLLAEYAKDQIFYELRSNKKSLAAILLIAIIAAIFSNFSSALENKQISEISFYVLYMLLITVCLASFKAAMTGLETRMEQLLDFMRVLCPGYFLSVAFASGSGSALMFYNLVLILIYIVEVVILRFLLPVINIYVMLQVMNHLLGENPLSEFTELLRKFITWTLKTLLGLVVGVNLIQGMLSPVIDTLKRSTLKQAVDYIPGAGDVIGGMTEIVLGSAVLIKNSIGIAGAVILILVSISPVVQIGILALLYKLAAALVQPVSDKRMTGCISSLSEGYELMLSMVCTILVLFLLTIAVVAASTS